jgi:hypothetical protein
MYTEDSYFTLSNPGQFGLLVVSGTLAAITLFACWRMTIKRRLFTRLIMGLAVFYAFVWLAPQVYYTYYIFLLGVPWQIIIQMPPSALSIVKLLSFSDVGNLSHHSRGLLGWLILITAMASPYLGKRSRR